MPVSHVSRAFRTWAHDAQRRGALAERAYVPRQDDLTPLDFQSLTQFAEAMAKAACIAWNGLHGRTVLGKCSKGCQLARLLVVDMAATLEAVGSEELP